MKQRIATEAAVAAGWHNQGVYQGETMPDMRKAMSDDERAAMERRRKIEDIREAARLEREVFGEVWEA
jgi:hypothetical protein